MYGLCISWAYINREDLLCILNIGKHNTISMWWEFIKLGCRLNCLSFTGIYDCFIQPAQQPTCWVDHWSRNIICPYIKDCVGFLFFNWFLDLPGSIPWWYLRLVSNRWCCDWVDLGSLPSSQTYRRTKPWSACCWSDQIPYPAGCCTGRLQIQWNNCNLCPGVWLKLSTVD